MPSTCCVPGCKSNYKGSGESVKVFKFPKENDKRTEWMKKIPRKDWVPTDSSVVCIHHFRESDIIKVDVINKPDGSVLSVPRERFKLTNNALPVLFPNLPTYLSGPRESFERKNPSDRHKAAVKREEQKFQTFLANDLISYEDLVSKSLVLKQFWNKILLPTSVTFYKLDVSSFPLTISSSFKVNSDLSIEIFINQEKIKNKNITWLLDLNGQNLFMKRWSQLENLIAHIDNVEKKSLSLDGIFSDLETYIKKYEKADEDSTLLNIKFLHEQLLLTLSKPETRRYSTIMLVWAFAQYIKSPACYKQMYENGILILPHVRNLQKLSSLISVESSHDGSEHIQYLKSKASKLERHELLVNLLLDEIIVRPQVNYRSGSLSGISVNKNLQKATSIQAYMMCSLYSKNKDVVAMLPVKNMTTNDLLIMTKNVIDKVQSAGYTIVSIISDNNRINRNMLTLLCGGNLQTSIPNTSDPSQKIFVLFDAVHILKCISNNWLNQQVVNETLFFPDFDNPNKILTASLNDLRSLHAHKKGRIVKYASKLTEKAFSLSGIERQNVALCLKIFHETNITALKFMNEEMYCGTIKFLEIIKWCKIVNIRNLKKGKECLDADSLPFASVSDDRLQFLKQFYDWLKIWRDVKVTQSRRQEKLMAETFCSLIHTT